MEKMEVREAITLENNGEKIFGILHRPKNAKGKVPALLICPGFGGTKSGKFRMFVTLAQKLAENGIAVFRFDYRGSGDSEGQFSDITLDGKIADALLCLSYLVKDSQIDSNRIGILGRSLGGAIAILAATQHPIKSLALWAPVFRSDPWKKLWDSFKANQIDISKEEVLKHLPINIPNPQFLSQFFQLDLQKEMIKLKSIPLLHIHGELDQIVKIEQARDFELARAGLNDTKFIQLPSSDHDFSNSKERDIVICETAMWCKEKL